MYISNLCFAEKLFWVSSVFLYIQHWAKQKPLAPNKVSQGSK